MIEVRGPGTPGEIIGHMAVSLGYPPPPDMTFRMKYKTAPFNGFGAMSSRYETIRVPIGELWLGRVQRWHAFRADDIPLETLRRIPEFREAK